MKNARLVVCILAVILSFAIGATSTPAANMDGVMMSDGKMMMMKDGKSSGRMDREMTMSDGTKVTPDGLVKMKDGKEMRMKDGDMMMMDGHFMEGGRAMGMHP